MPTFANDGIALHYEVHGEGEPILLIHGFGSSGKINWIDTGWVQTLMEAGYQRSPSTIAGTGRRGCCTTRGSTMRTTWPRTRAG